MTANSYIETVKNLPVLTANAQLEEMCGVQGFFEHLDDMSAVSDNRDKDEYGDWQTNMNLALDICRILKKNGVNPQVVIEPTCGKGHFILAALQIFDNIEDIYGIEIYKPYLEELKIQILQYSLDNTSRKKVRIHLYHQNIFDFDFIDIKKSINGREILVLGNPPWVTNSKLSGLNSKNLPKKNNFKKFNGLDAITGKSNFDIAENICRKVIDFLGDEKANLALLLKNSVIKNIIYGQQENELKIGDIYQYNIDAKKEFDVSVAASLFCCTFSDEIAKHCIIKDFYSLQNIQKYGWVNNCFVSDTDAYKKYSHIDGQSQLTWWSGIKHDCAKVMELSYDGIQYTNGLGEVVDIEDDMIYPLIKSSDIKEKVITSTRKYVIITQQSTSDDTEWIKWKYPKTYQYLLSHAEYLDNRGSRIYKGRSRFCIFGVGKYSFKPYKIIISGLYKKPEFSIVSPIAGKSVMLDDTCYMLGLDSLNDAMITQKLLDSDHVRCFINSLVFIDAKRVINKELLMRIDLIKALEYIYDYNIEDSEIQRYLAMLKGNIVSNQLSLF